MKRKGKSFESESEDGTRWDGIWYLSLSLSKLFSHPIHFDSPTFMQFLYALFLLHNWNGELINLGSKWTMMLHKRESEWDDRREEKILLKS